ncbi:MAG: hypothetical protein K2H92_04945 [Bacteroidaceae bacterium]|nr:hypothetical protein [Bacteroidaceae bacterium]
MKKRTFASMNIPSIFNCSNDMALAAHVRQYLPPKRIQCMERDLAELARVWEGTRFAGPWGWSLATKQRYKQMGVPVDALPSDEWLEAVRRLSSREFACGYVKELLEELDDPRLLGGDMRWCDRHGFDDAAFSTSKSMSPTPTDRCPRLRPTDVPDSDFVGQKGLSQFIFKSPWSSSGRGVFVAEVGGQVSTALCQGGKLRISDFPHSAAKRLQGFLSAQGGFLMDRFYADKVLDFAMEFFIHDDHAVEFLGYSVFATGEHGAYGHNYVECQDALLRRIDVDVALLNRLIAHHRAHLAKTAYRGPVGIDMLKTADGSVHPCLEINFRLNMGILALLLHERYGSHAMVDLTPRRGQGFQAKLEQGKFFLQMNAS